MRGKFSIRIGSLLIVIYFLIFVCFGIGCGTVNTNDTGSCSQEFLGRDVEIDWSAVEPVERKYATWFNTFAFAAVSRVDDELFIHGEFDSDLPVTLLNGSGFPVNQGFTGSQEEYTGAACSFPYTELNIEIEFPIDSPSWQQHDFIFAIVGEFEDYEVIPLWPWNENRYGTTAESVSSLAQNAAQNQNVRGLKLIEHCGNPEIFRFFSGENDGIMVCFEQTGSISENLLRTYVVIYNGNHFTVVVECASTPILFRVNGELFLWAKYSGYHYGVTGQLIRHLHEDGKCWSNFDWSD